MAEPRAPRTRRSGDEVRALILVAAREVFSHEGYAGATTREIATRAGIAEPLIFRNFGDKAGLFRHAVFDPFEAFVHGYAEQATARFATWTDDGDLDEPLARAYIEGLYDHLRANRGLFMALLRTRFEDDAGALDAAVPLDRMFKELEAIAEAGLTAAGFHAPDVALIVRFTFGLTLSIAVLDDWLLPRGRNRPSRKRIVDELLGFVTQGVNRNPPSPVGRTRSAAPDRSGDAQGDGQGDGGRGRAGPVGDGVRRRR